MATSWESHVLHLVEMFLVNNQWKCFKIPEMLSFAESNSFWGGKLFSLIFVPFHWFDQKKSFPSNQNFSSGFVPFQTHWEKITFLVILSIFSEIVTFYTLKRSLFVNFRRKCFKGPEMLSCMCHIMKSNTIFGNICPILLVWSKKVISIKSKYILRIYPVSNSLKKKQLSV